MRSCLSYFSLKDLLYIPIGSTTLINTDILNQIPGEQRIYHSYDEIMCDNDNDISNYSVEFLYSLTISGLPHSIES